MKKSDLRTGMTVVFEDGREFLVMRGVHDQDGDFLVPINGSVFGLWFISLPEDLSSFIRSEDTSIKEVWEFSHNMATLNTGEKTTLIWRNRPKPVEIQLNSGYKAVIQPEIKNVKVGCQDFSFDRIKELAKAIENAENQQK